MIVSQNECDELNASIAETSVKLLCVVRSSNLDYGLIVIGVGDSSLMLRDRAWLPFTTIGNYRDLPRRYVVDNLSIRTDLLRQ